MTYNVEYSQLSLREKTCDFGDYSSWLLVGNYTFKNKIERDVSIGRIGISGTLWRLMCVNDPNLEEKDAAEILLSLAKKNYLQCVDFMLDENLENVVNKSMHFEHGKRETDSPFWETWPKFIFCSDLLDDPDFVSVWRK